MIEACTGIAYPYLDEAGHKKHVGEIGCSDTPPCELCYTLLVTSNIENVPIMVSPPDDFGRTNGLTDFQRIYAMTPGVTVELDAPLVHMGLEFRYWRIDNMMPYIFNTHVEVTMDGVMCHTAAAIYGEVFPPGGCGPGCLDEVPSVISISGTFTEGPYADPGNCNNIPCPTNANECNTVWANVRHSALAFFAGDSFGEFGYTSGFPAGPGDPQGENPQCMAFADPTCGGNIIGFGICPDGCAPGLDGMQWKVPCGAEFYARVKCICDVANGVLIARVAAGLEMAATRWATCGGQCSQLNTSNPHFLCGLNNEPGQDFVLASIKTSVDCCDLSHLMLRSYAVPVFGESHPGGINPPCNRLRWGTITFSL